MQQDVEAIWNEKQKEREEQDQEEPIPTFWEAVEAPDIVRRYFTSFTVDGPALMKQNSRMIMLLNAWNSSKTRQKTLLEDFKKEILYVCMVNTHAFCDKFVDPTNCSTFIVMLSSLQVGDN
jgi:hypothetical protein